jgi:hypothetical protein
MHHTDRPSVSVPFDAQRAGLQSPVRTPLLSHPWQITSGVPLQNRSLPPPGRRTPKSFLEVLLSSVMDVAFCECDQQTLHMQCEELACVEPHGLDDAVRVDNSADGIVHVDEMPKSMAACDKCSVCGKRGGFCTCVIDHFHANLFHLEPNTAELIAVLGPLVPPDAARVTSSGEGVDPPLLEGATEDLAARRLQEAVRARGAKKENAAKLIQRAQRKSSLRRSCAQAVACPPMEEKTWPDGSFFSGHLVDGEPHGYGTMQLPCGDVYEGEWLSGARHGEGTLTRGADMPDASATYRGQWRGGLKHGTGVEAWSDGSRYEGQFQNGEAGGHGKLILRSGLVRRVGGGAVAV